MDQLICAIPHVILLLRISFRMRQAVAVLVIPPGKLPRDDMTTLDSKGLALNGLQQTLQNDFNGEHLYKMQGFWHCSDRMTLPVAASLEAMYLTF